MKTVKPGHIQLPGYVSCYPSVKQALHFDASSDIELKIVLFAICVQNYWEFQGIRLNTPRYSAHPHESEYVLMEGCPMMVLGVDEVRVDGLKDESGSDLRKSIGGHF